MHVTVFKEFILYSKRMYESKYILVSSGI